MSSLFPPCSTSNISILGHLGPILVLGSTLYSCLGHRCLVQVDKFPLADTIPTPTGPQLQENGQGQSLGTQKAVVCKVVGGSFLSPSSEPLPVLILCPHIHLCLRAERLQQEKDWWHRVPLALSCSSTRITSRPGMGLLIPTSEFKSAAPEK